MKKKEYDTFATVTACSACAKKLLEAWPNSTKGGPGPKSGSTKQKSWRCELCRQVKPAVSWYMIRQNA